MPRRTLNAAIVFESNNFQLKGEQSNTVAVFSSTVDYGVFIGIFGDTFLTCGLEFSFAIMAVSIFMMSPNELGCMQSDSLLNNGAFWGFNATIIYFIIGYQTTSSSLFD